MRSLLFILISFIGVTSTISGLLLIGSRDGSLFNLPLSLLNDTPFKDYLVPGILLTIMVGLVNLLAVFFNMQRHANRYNWAMAGGIMVSGWIVVQLLLIDTVNWFHFLYLGTGILIFLLARHLKRKWAG
jgi:hypothetical protein